MILKRVVFYAICRYFENIDNTSEYDEEKLRQWMRVVWNIVENANEMVGAMRLIDELAEYSHSIYIYLASNAADTITSITATEQVAEEREKAKLILSNGTNWEQELKKAESHSYFRGQIYFLLHISGNDKNKFIEYRDKAIAVFHKNMEQ